MLWGDGGDAWAGGDVALRGGGVEPRARRALFPEATSPRVATDERVRARGASCPSPPPAPDLAGEAPAIAGSDEGETDGELAWAHEVLRWASRALLILVVLIGLVGVVGAMLIIVYAGWLRLLGYAFGAAAVGVGVGVAPGTVPVTSPRDGSGVWTSGGAMAVVMVGMGVAWSSMGSGDAALRGEGEGREMARGARARKGDDPHAVASATADAPRRGLLRLLDVAQERARAGFGRGIFRCLGDAHASDRSRSAAGRGFVRRRVRRPT